MENMKLIKLDESIYEDYKIDVIFNAYKWDPQVGDYNTVSKHVLLISEEMAQKLKEDAEALTKETIKIQETMLQNLDLTKDIGLSKKMKRYFSKLKDYNRNQHVSLMRYDFHPTIDGLKISEVNSDVPGGLPESSKLPLLAKKYLGYGEVKFDIANVLYKEFIKINKDIKHVAFVHATSYADDRQVMQYVGDFFEEKGIKSSYVDPTSVKFKETKAYYQNELIDGLFRFYPLEWLENLPITYKWKNYFHTSTISCNHPINILSQSKRIPIVWDKLNINLDNWKRLLPNTVDTKKYFDEKLNEKNYILKPNLGRVGEGVSIDEVISKTDKIAIEKAAKKFPKNWVAQEKFISKPLTSSDGEIFHLCIGVFTVNESCAGFYGRISYQPRIDEHAIDIPILVVKAEDLK